MEQLRNLQSICKLAVERFNEYKGEDFVLPQLFKDQVKEINSNHITYNKYSAVIETRGSQNGILNIYMPNQWFYVASYFTEFYNELQKYKSYSLKVVSKERLKNLNGSVLTEKEQEAIKRLDIDEQSQEFLVRFITDYTWWCGAKTIDRGDFYVSPILNSAKLVNASQSFVADLCAFLSNKEELVKAIILGEESREDRKINNDENKELPFQQIFYGAPGTGKSHKIKGNEQVKKAEEKKLVFRTTFHPDSDYSTFVGAYKPTMKKQYRYDGKVKAKYYEDDDLADAKKDDIIIDKVIQYDFVPQSFINAYVAAWKNQDEKVFLIIEEINRGNCAQIFGDLFQLLDRDENGVSEYKIKADADIKAHLEKELGQDSDGIKDGELCLPKNLYIWATMNTSDQSLFPIDSAFKRRWDWEYEPIKYSNKEWKIEIGNNKYSWTSFQKKVNDRIFRDFSSEDKMLGDYFVHPRDGVISEKLLLNKILFYLWNDVCKDGDGDIFKTEDDKEVKFSELYGEEGTEKLLSMMKQLDVELVVASDEDVEEYENSKDNTKYSINGIGSYAKRSLSTELVKVYISQHPEMPATEVVNKWKNLGNFVSHFIETQDEYDKRTDQNPRVNIIQCNGEYIYVSTNGWGGQGVMDSLIGAIPKDWNLNVEKI